MKLKVCAGTALLLFATSCLNAQDLNQLIRGSNADASYLVKGYVSPLFNVIGNGLNQGWYNTAKPHKLLGFDLTVTASGVFFPSSDMLFRVNDSQLTSIKNSPYSPGVTTSKDVPTIFGNDATPQYQVVDPNSGAAIGSPINGAQGSNISKYVSFVPVPMAQLGIGLPKGTDLKFRYVPTLKFGGSSGTFGLIGFALMHDVKQYIPGVKALPFDLSVLVGYTKTELHVDGDQANNQKGNLTASATTVQALISKKFSVLTLYGAAGYNFTSNSLSVNGKYNLLGDGTYVPIDVSLSNSQSGPRVTAGFRLKFAILTLHADYTLQKYNAFTAGFGFNVR